MIRHHLKGENLILLCLSDGGYLVLQELLNLSLLKDRLPLPRTPDEMLVYIVDCGALTTYSPLNKAGPIQTSRHASADVQVQAVSKQVTDEDSGRAA